MVYPTGGVVRVVCPLSSEYLVELREYGSVYAGWAGAEEALRPPLEGVAGCVAACCGAMEDLSESMSQELLPVLREYGLYIEALKVGPPHRGRAST